MSNWFLPTTSNELDSAGLTGNYVSQRDNILKARLWRHTGSQNTPFGAHLRANSGVRVWHPDVAASGIQLERHVLTRRPEPASCEIPSSRFLICDDLLNRIGASLQPPVQSLELLLPLRPLNIPLDDAIAGRGMSSSGKQRAERHGGVCSHTLTLFDCCRS